MTGQAYQVEQHAKALERWHPPAEALALARHYVESGQAWRWPDPPAARSAPLQLRLFA